MEYLYFCIIIYLFLLAIFDLSVGVSNDAVNFLNSAIGTKAASFKKIIIVASIGVFFGAAMSNGMMDIARHGIFQPEHFSFYDLICIFMAVMVTDIILLDIFNTQGLPTSTTVSMIFAMLGAAFVIAIIKMANGMQLELSELLNTGKALSIVIGIFLSVAIAFFFGTVVQFIARLVFTFSYRNRLKWKIGIFGGICTTMIIYFLLIKGAGQLTFMTPDLRAWISHNNGLIIVSCFIFFSILMQILYLCKVNVLKVIVLLGTFALAMAFAGNDLVNFIGVPLSGLESYQAYHSSGSISADEFMMGSLNAPATTPAYYLIAAGVIMIVSLATSKKVRTVTDTAIGLSSQQSNDEMFGSSRIARKLVRFSLALIYKIRQVTPPQARRWYNKRFQMDGTQLEDGAAFDLIRGSVNLVLASALIAIGTSLKLPLSTTFVTFMVAMGTSLADKAWGRESAVFRITGVISVIGGWFITAGAAFIAAGILAAAMHYGGNIIIVIIATIAVFIIIRSNRNFNKKEKGRDSDVLFRTIISTKNKNETWPLLLLYIKEQQQKFLIFASKQFSNIADAFITENAGMLSKSEHALVREKNNLKNARRKETLCLRYVTREIAIEKSTWFYLGNNCCMSILYNLRRINEICKEHVDNNFRPLPKTYHEEYDRIRSQVIDILNESIALMDCNDAEKIMYLRNRCEQLKNIISESYHNAYDQLREGEPSSMSVLYVYVNMLQETRELISSLRKQIRAFAKLRDSEFRTRPIISKKM